MPSNNTVFDALSVERVIAILRGVTPDKALEVGHALVDAQVRFIEVPLTDPNAIECIKILKANLPTSAYVGAGTVVTLTQLEQVISLNVDFALAPNMNQKIIEQAILHDFPFIPGVATASEAIDAVQAGAKWLKLFPYLSYPASHINALKTVLPNCINVLAVGGVNSNNVNSCFENGAQGVGIGKDLYQKGDLPQQVFAKAKAFLELIS